MSRYHFHSQQRTSLDDREGCEIETKELARKHAVQLAGTLAAEAGDELYDDSLSVVVTDDTGSTLWVVHVVAMDTPAGRVSGGPA